MVARSLGTGAAASVQLITARAKAPVQREIARHVRDGLLTNQAALAYPVASSRVVVRQSGASSRPPVKNRVQFHAKSFKQLQLELNKLPNVNADFTDNAHRNHTIGHLARTILDTPTPSQPGSSKSHQEARLRVYDNLINSLIPHPGFTDLLFSILERERQESLESNEHVSVVFKYAIDAQYRRADRMPILERIMPFLPTTPDSVLLTQLVRVLVDSTDIEPESVRVIISGCVADMVGEKGGKGAQEGRGVGEGGGMGMWEWGLWDAYLGSFGKKGQWRGAMDVLSQFKGVVRMQAHARGGRRRVDGLEDSDKETIVWTGDELDAIARPFITVLSLFTDTTASSVLRREARYMSKIPSIIVNDYLALVYTQRQHLETIDNVPVLQHQAMWNAWMNAERVVGNLDLSERLWESISGTDIHGTPTICTILPCRPGADMQPDAWTYTTLFKLLKQRSKSIPTRVFDRFMASPALNATSLNDALSCVFSNRPTSPDDIITNLQHARRILSAFHTLPQTSPHLPERDTKPDERTIDIVTSGLLKLWRAGLPIWDPSQRGRIPLSRGIRSLSDGAPVRTTPLAISAPEWDLASSTLHALYVESVRERSRVSGREERAVDKANRAWRLELPMGRPVGRLQWESGRRGVDGRSEEKEIVARCAPEERAARVRRMMGPLTRLVERAERVALGRQAGVEMGVDVEDVEGAGKRVDG